MLDLRIDVYLTAYGFCGCVGFCQSLTIAVEIIGFRYLDLSLVVWKVNRKNTCDLLFVIAKEFESQ